MRTTFDAESLGTLERVLEDVCLELGSGKAANEASQPTIPRERLAKLILHYAQDGESDPATLRTLVLKGVGRG